MAPTFKRARILFFFFFLVLYAGSGCLGGQTKPKVASSSRFQTVNQYFILECIPNGIQIQTCSSAVIEIKHSFITHQAACPICNKSGPKLFFRVNGTEIFNSHNKFNEGVYCHDDTSIRVEHPKVIRKEIDPKTYLPNVTCSYDNVTSSNSLNIPYYNIDKFSSHVLNQSSKLGQAINISCEMALNPLPRRYSVRFVSDKKLYFEANVLELKYSIKKHSNDFVILDQNIREVYHWTTVSIKIGPSKKYNRQSVRMQCELQVPDYGKKPIIRSNDFTNVKFN